MVSCKLSADSGTSVYTQLPANQGLYKANNCNYLAYTTFSSQSYPVVYNIKHKLHIHTHI